MYATICYFNYRKDVSFNILKTFIDFEKADAYALKCAEEQYGDDVIQGVSDKRVYVDEEIDGYTTGDGYDKLVYTVISIPEADDCIDLVEEETQLEIKQKNGRYEWGFDLTDFNEDGDQSGAIKFQKLLNKFDMELVSMKEGFMWENDGSIVMITANNPLTGKYHNQSRNPEKGYLSYVGISCESPNILQKFINEFRSKASYVKDESNARVFI